SGDLVSGNSYLIELGARPTIVENNIAAGMPVQLLQAGLESGNFRLAVASPGERPPISTATCRVWSRFCACAASGHETVAPPSAEMNCRLRCGLPFARPTRTSPLQST